MKCITESSNSEYSYQIYTMIWRHFIAPMTSEIYASPVTTKLVVGLHSRNLSELNFKTKRRFFKRLPLSLKTTASRWMPLICINNSQLWMFSDRSHRTPCSQLHPSRVTPFFAAIIPAASNYNFCFFNSGENSWAQGITFVVCIRELLVSRISQGTATWTHHFVSFLYIRSRELCKLNRAYEVQYQTPTPR
jgi:hypothetical protein